MSYTNKSKALKTEIERVSEIIQTTNSTYLRRDLEKYLKRLEKEVRFGGNKKSRPMT